MNLPAYIRRPLCSAAERGMYHGQLVIGYVEPTTTAWLAKLDEGGAIVDEVAVVVLPADYQAWSRRVEREARRRGEALAIIELDDDAMASTMTTSSTIQ